MCSECKLVVYMSTLYVGEMGGTSYWWSRDQTLRRNQILFEDRLISTEEIRSTCLQFTCLLSVRGKWEVLHASGGGIQWTLHCMCLHTLACVCTGVDVYTCVYDNTLDP